MAVTDGSYKTRVISDSQIAMEVFESKKEKEKLVAAGVAFDQRVMGSSYIGTAHDAATFSLLFISRRQPPPPPSLP